jgi:signal transduction histidine kinase/DNA-binding response OmpR family regulator/HPt (histidine-containing phosphotransfer) domain-containing protein
MSFGDTSQGDDAASWSWTRRSLPEWVLIWIGLAVVYAGAGRLGQVTAIPPGNVTAVWPPSGIALAAILLFGYRAWPGVWLGSLIGNGAHFYSSEKAFQALLTGSSIGVGASLEAIAGAWLLSLCKVERRPFRRTGDVVLFSLLSALVSSSISSTNGVTAMCMGGFVEWSGYRKTWLTWWLGDSVGILLFTPLIMTWVSLPGIKPRLGRVVEGLFLSLILCGAGLAAFVGDYPLEYLLIPMLMWASFRFGIHGATAAILTVSVIAIGGTAHGGGSFVRASFNEPLLMLQAFIGTVTVTTLTLTAVLTERRKAEAGLEEYSQRLEQRVDDRTIELRHARQVAEQSNKAKGVFLATMSHEIRTPLNAVLGMASLLQDTDLTAQQHEFARVIRTSGEALLGVINDILDFSKIEAGHMELEREPLDLRACVEGAMDVIAVRGSEKGLELAYEIAPDVPAWIVGDVTRLRQVLINLLSNAVKFTERGEVVVMVNSASVADDRYGLSFAVRDTGLGIPPDRISRLFGAFSQVDASTTRKYGGTGLGLAISKRLAEMMGGQMEVTSQPGEGSIFRFTIVTQGAPPPTDPEERPVDLPDLTTKRLLIVDDNETNRRLVVLMTQGWGLKTRDTGSPLEALGWIEAGEQFDLAILDIAMPEMDGPTLATILRQPHYAPNMPLVAFTSLTRREALGDRREFEAFVTKPLKPASLFEVLVALLSGRRHVARDRLNKTEFDSTLGVRLPLRILVADDVPVNQQMMGVMLGRMAYEADFADNGREALRALARRPYELIFMDMQMPEMDGLECTREIVRGYPVDGRPRIVALTANVMADDMRECKIVGMDDFLTKPIKPSELRQCLERWGQAVADGRDPGRGASPVPTEPGVAPTPGAVMGRVPDLEIGRQPGPDPGPRPGMGGIEDGPPSPAPDVALIDEIVMADLRELDSFEPGLLQSFIDGFRQAESEHVPLIYRAIEAGDAEELRQAAHRLRGTAANVGACGVAAQCAALEKLGRSGSVAGGASLVRELERRYHQSTILFALMRTKNE